MEMVRGERGKNYPEPESTRVRTRPSGLHLGTRPGPDLTQRPPRPGPGFRPRTRGAPPPGRFGFSPHRHIRTAAGSAANDRYRRTSRGPLDSRAQSVSMPMSMKYMDPRLSPATHIPSDVGRPVQGVGLRAGPWEGGGRGPAWARGKGRRGRGPE